MTLLQRFIIRMRICMASDFFYPNMGGVEEHIFNLSQCLVQNGNKVIVITHCYGDRTGIRYMTNGLKVYYLPIQTFYNQCILPTMICQIPLLRDILIRERIEIVHGHSAFSALAHEAMFVGSLLNLRTVFTDHSLFGFADLSAVFTNKFLQIALSPCNHCICVSHTGKENTVLRAAVKKDQVSVIPNAVDTALFTPNPINSSNLDQAITVVVVSRLVYRKGVDLLAGVISRLCAIPEYKEVNFLIGGDGPKRVLLEEIREKRNIQERITLLGALEHADVRNVLTRGQIFLNTSLTEAYCMAIVEAASCGLQVVSTRVGGIPEVLPEELIVLTEPTVDSVLAGLCQAIDELKTRYRKHNQQSMGDFHRGRSKEEERASLCPFERNQRVAQLYNWRNVSDRTEIVYRRVLNEPNKHIGEKMLSYLRSGVWPFLLVVALGDLIVKFLDWWSPRCNIDICKDFPLEQFKAQRPHRTISHSS